MKAKRVSQERDPRLKGLRQLKDLPAEEKPPGQSERARSKDELIQLLIKSTEESLDLGGDAITDAIPVLLFVRHALDQDDFPENVEMRTPDGTKYKYCHLGNGAGEILKLLAEDLYRNYGNIQKVETEIYRVKRAIKEGKKPVLREPRA